jgi:hypothetical protein
LRRVAAKISQTVENDREISSPSGPGQIQRSLYQLCLISRDWRWHGPLRRRRHRATASVETLRTTSARLLEHFLSEFRGRQRDELLRQPVWRICFERAHGFALRHNVRPYPAGVAAVVACAAVISIRIYQQPEHVQVAVESSPVPTRSPNTEKELDFAPPVLIPTFNGDPTFLPASRDVPLLPADLLQSDEFVPLNLEREALGDQPLLEK